MWRSLLANKLIGVIEEEHMSDFTIRFFCFVRRPKAIVTSSYFVRSYVPITTTIIIMVSKLYEMTIIVIIITFIILYAHSYYIFLGKLCVV